MTFDLVVRGGQVVDADVVRVLDIGIIDRRIAAIGHDLPAGVVDINADGQFAPEDWWAAIFNPSFPYRLVHMVLAAYLTTALVVGAVGAWHLLRDAADPAARRMFAMAMGMIVVVAPIQIVAGDLHGLNTIEHQPAKIAAMEGHYETRAGAPLILYGPWRERGELLVYSNRAFDAKLKERDPRFGLRELTAWATEARAAGFALAERRDMPANNLMLRFERLGS